jgi:hypothetical protein
MATYVIDLSTFQISVGDISGWRFKSLHYALLKNETIVFGAEAKSKAKLYPTASFNTYWESLSTEPINHSYQRHYVDLAYGHLVHLSERLRLKIKSDVLVIVPSHYDRTQLALFLGIAKHTLFNVTGMIDAAVVAGMSVTPSSNFFIYLDIQSQQAVATHIDFNTKLSRGTVSQIPGVGIQNIFDKLANVITDAFISQCRFNPQHNAESEQQLYDKIPAWIECLVSEPTATLTLKHADSNYRAKLSQAQLIDALREYYKKISSHLLSLRSNVKNELSIILFVDAWFSNLPVIEDHLDPCIELRTIDQEDRLKRIFSRKSDFKKCDVEAELTTAIPLTDPKGIGDIVYKTGEPEDSPTHALIGNQAFSICDVVIVNQRLMPESSNFGLTSRSPSKTLGSLVFSGEKLYAKNFVPELLVNDNAPTNSELIVGDILSIDGSFARLIRVQDVEH